MSVLTSAVATVIVTGCSGAASFGPSSSPAPSPSTAGASSTPASTDSPATTGFVGPSRTPADGWRPVLDLASGQDVQFLHVAWTGKRFVATGSALDGDGAFLDSDDGLTWHRQVTLPADGFPDSVAVGPGGVVAVGTIAGKPASWISGDGLTWTSRAGVFPAKMSGTDAFRVTAVVANETGWLAVGREDPYCNVNCGLAPVRALAWTSTDGLHWAEVPHQTSLGGAAMTGVALGGPGFVAVGSAGVSGAVWTSTDGSSWSRVVDDPVFHARPGIDWAAMTGVAVHEGIVVAVGSDGQLGGGGGSARAWWSADGQTWAEAAGDRFLSGQIFSVAATPEGFLATGPSGDTSCLGGIWASTDGHAWLCVASDPAFMGFSPYAAAASSSVEVVVGIEASTNPPPEGFPGAVWRRALT